MTINQIRRVQKQEYKQKLKETVLANCDKSIYEEYPVVLNAYINNKLDFYNRKIDEADVYEFTCQIKYLLEYCDLNDVINKYSSVKCQDEDIKYTKRSLRGRWPQIRQQLDIFKTHNAVNWPSTWPWLN